MCTRVCAVGAHACSPAAVLVHRGSRGAPTVRAAHPMCSEGPPAHSVGCAHAAHVPAVHVRTCACEHSCAHVGVHTPALPLCVPQLAPSRVGVQRVPPTLPGPCSRGASPAPPAWPRAGGSPACLSGEITGPRRPGHGAQPAPQGPPRPPPTRCPGLGRGRTGVLSHRCTPRPPRCAGHWHRSYWESQSGCVPLPAAKTPNLPPTSWGPPQRHLPPGGVVGGDTGSDHPP